jgi:glycosyltransferase involved in cell wall biosynthesis
MSQATEPRAKPARRVLHILKFYRPDFSGEGVFLERSSAVMQEIAPSVTHELVVLDTPRPAADNPPALCSTLARVTYLAETASDSALKKHARLAAWMARNIHRFDTVHVRTHADWYFVSYLIARLAGRRLVLSATLDDSLPVLTARYRPSLRGLAARGFRLFDAFVAISPKLQAENLSVGGTGERSRLIPCGVTVPTLPEGERETMRARLGIPPDAPMMLFVGGLCARKDPLALVEALPAIRRDAPDTRLVLVGPPLEPDYVARIEARIGEFGLADAVTIAGEQLNPHPYFAAADMLAFASRLEGFGTVVPEAMAHGLPVVARRLPGVNEEFVVHGRTGFAFDDQAGLVAGAVQLARDRLLRARLGAAGRELAEAKFSMRAVARRYLEAYGQAEAIEPEAETAPPTLLGTGASVKDRRFHLPAPEVIPDEPLLLTMVDAEEAFDWGAAFSRDSADVSSMRSQALAHRVFERHGVTPLYLVTYPVATRPEGRDPLRELVAGGAAEVGAQLHPWVCPPYVEPVCERNSYVGNLPPWLELEKARSLTGAIGEAFGEAPRIFRAGRFGAGPRTADVLKRLGYLADSSIVPHWPAEPRRATAERWMIGAAPFWLDAERTLLEIPVSSALVGRFADRAGGELARWLFGGGPFGGIGAGLLARGGMIERIRLTPEGITLEEAKRLARAMHAGGHRVFVLTYHSPSLEPGNTPYVRSVEDRQRLLDWLDGFYTFFREELRGRPASWREVRFGAAARLAQAA